MASRSKAERERLQLEATAYHEAGHAVVAINLRRAIRHVSILPKDDFVGHVLKTTPPASIRPEVNGDRRTQAWIEREVMIGLAGMIAEGIFQGRHNHIGASSDYSAIADLASYVHGYGEVLTKWVDYMIARTRAYVRSPRIWIQVEAVAAELLTHKQLGARRVREICAAAPNNTERFRELNREARERSEAKRLKDLAAIEREKSDRASPTTAPRMTERA